MTFEVVDLTTIPTMEYKLIVGTTNSIDTQMNTEAAEGWRFVSMTVIGGAATAVTGMPNTRVYVMMERPTQ